MFGVRSVNRLACPSRKEDFYGRMAVAAGTVIEGFSDARVRLDFPARSMLYPTYDLPDFASQIDLLQRFKDIVGA
jgi:hypothetical protein